MSRAPDAEGTVPFGEHRTWYRVTGPLYGAMPALVVVHGGPGSTHDYLVGLADLADDGWPVVHYDQLGSGGSTRLPDAPTGFWTPELFLAELDTLLTRLGIADDYVLFGHSWGGALAAAHAATRPAGLRGLVVADAPASYPDWAVELDRLRAALPPGVDEVLRAHEAAGTTGSDEYHAAARVFYNRHVCRVDPWPPEYTASALEVADNPTVYHAMNGPAEFHVTGSLRDWSVMDLLPAITTPTLVLVGEHDEVTPAAAAPFAELVPGAELAVIDGASHLPHLERPEVFHAALSGFLDRVRGHDRKGILP